MRRLILASASPRRRELLSTLGISFEVVPSAVDESDTGVIHPPERFAAALAKEKGSDVWLRERREPGDVVVLGADTIVVSQRLGPATLGKPVDEEDARRMLRLLSGTTHAVYTGLAVVATDPKVPDYSTKVEVVETRVIFRELTPAMIDSYIATGEPFDKAGAYGIQGHAGAFVEYIEGDYYNVVGLPLERVRAMLLPFFPEIEDAPPPPPLPFPIYPKPAAES